MKPFNPKETHKSLEPLEDGVPLNDGLKYDIFPKFDSFNFYVPREIKNYNNEDNFWIK